MKLFKTMDMELLEDLDACERGKEYFRDNFYDGAPTVEVLLKSPQYADWICDALELYDEDDEETHQELTEYLYQKAKSYLPEKLFEATHMCLDV